MTKNKSNIEVKHEGSAPAQAGSWAPLDTLREEVDRLFDDFGSGLWKRPLSQRVFGRLPVPADWRLSPAVEIVDCDGEYRLTAELPGMAPADVEVKLTDGMIAIRGEKSEDKKEEKEDYILSERRYGSFHRSLPLPAGIDTSAVSANFANGVLTITMPKSAEAKNKERKIEIKAA